MQLPRARGALPAPSILNHDRPVAERMLLGKAGHQLSHKSLQAWPVPWQAIGSSSQTSSLQKSHEWISSCSRTGGTGQIPHLLVGTASVRHVAVNCDGIHRSSQDERVALNQPGPGQRWHLPPHFARAGLSSSINGSVIRIMTADRKQCMTARYDTV